MDLIPATFLHVTDAHIAYAGRVLERDDRKNPVVSLLAQTREAALRQIFERLAERLRREGRTLDGVIFFGDAKDRGRQGGHELLLHLLLNCFGPFGITEKRIFATLGNHDVDHAYDPGTAERYKDFCATWRDCGCVVPWIDGVDEVGPPARQSPRHPGVAVASGCYPWRIGVIVIWPGTGHGDARLPVSRPATISFG